MLSFFKIEANRGDVMGFQVDSTDFKSGKVPVKGLLAVVAVGLVAAALAFALTSVFDLKLTFKTIVSALVAIASFIGIIANLEDFLSLIERFTGVELRPKAKSRQVEAPKAKRLRVLAVMPRPLDAPMLMHLADPEKFIGKFQKIKAPADIDFVRPPTFDEFHTKLKNGYDIVHFDGHGSPKTLYFETEDCLKSEIPVKKFAEALKSVSGRRPKLIVLSACEAAGGRKSFAERLHKLTKASVVGFAKRVTIEETSAFSERLYEELGSGKILGEAFDSAVDALREKYPDAAKAARLFGKRSLRLVKPGSKGEVRVEAVEQFGQIFRPKYLKRFVGVFTGDPKRPGRMDMLHTAIRKSINRLEAQNIVLFHGDGGFGKTTLAYEAVRRLAPRFGGGVFWFHGAGKQKIELESFLISTFGTHPELKNKLPSFPSIAPTPQDLSELRTPQQRLTHSQRLEAIVREFLDRMSQQRKRVLVFADGLDYASKEVWNFLLTLPERCFVIATCRKLTDEAQGVPTAILVKEMLPEESLLMLTLHLENERSMSQEDRLRLGEIAELTYGMPLVIFFAAKDVSKKGINRLVKRLLLWYILSLANLLFCNL